jgi:prepilin-type N-terminal cleavage/methylation domain-containing protein/prepilin-type processing-associated H-X9-DG protein
MLLRNVFRNKAEDFTKTAQLRRKRMENRKTQVKPAFTLVELLVVISIIALLLAILMPSLNKARQAAFGIKCGANMRNVGAATLSYTTDYEYYPCSYFYPDQNGSFNSLFQITPTYGYAHWSYFVADGGRCKDDAFKCPAMPRGGAPRTNPGPKSGDWESGQVDDAGGTSAYTSAKTDQQASRMSLTANAAIIPRNKFTPASVQAEGGNAQRVNRFVKPAEVSGPSTTIAATEFNQNWKQIGQDASGGVKSKSHRPIMPFYSFLADSSNVQIYGADPSISSFMYHPPGENLTNTNFGIVPSKDLTAVLKDAVLDGPVQINAVGRHHPGQGETAIFGGCANFLYCDGHVERKAVMETMKRYEWGKAFYSLTGSNQILLNR